MNKHTLIILRVNERAEGFYDKSLELGTLAAQTFLEEIEHERQRHRTSTEQEARALQKHRAQLTGLENIAETALKFTDVLDYIKKQIARQPGWKNEYQGQRFGESLKTYIEGHIKEQADHIYAEVRINTSTDEGKREHQHIYLQLIRQLIRQIVVQYEYRVSQIAEELQHDKRARTGADTPSQRL